VITSEDPARLGRELSTRYTTADLKVLTRDEARRFAPDGALRSVRVSENDKNWDEVGDHL
jgi:hypothetical protein